MASYPAASSLPPEFFVLETFYECSRAEGSPPTRCSQEWVGVRREAFTWGINTSDSYLVVPFIIAKGMVRFDLTYYFLPWFLLAVMMVVTKVKER